MKLTLVLALFTLSVIVQGNLIAVVSRPVILSLGSIFTAMIAQDSLSEMHFEWSNILPFSKKSSTEEYEFEDEDDYMKYFEKPRDYEKLKGYRKE